MAEDQSDQIRDEGEGLGVTQPLNTDSTAPQNDLDRATTEILDVGQSLFA